MAASKTTTKAVSKQRAARIGMAASSKQPPNASPESEMGAEDESASDARRSTKKSAPVKPVRG